MNDALERYLRVDHPEQIKEIKLQKARNEQDKKLKEELEADKEQLNAELSKGIDWGDYKPPLIKKSHIEKSPLGQNVVTHESDQEQQITKKNNNNDLENKPNKEKLSCSIKPNAFHKVVDNAFYELFNGNKVNHIDVYELIQNEQLYYDLDKQKGKETEKKYDNQ